MCQKLTDRNISLIVQRSSSQGTGSFNETIFFWKYVGKVTPVPKILENSSRGSKMIHSNGKIVRLLKKHEQHIVYFRNFATASKIYCTFVKKNNFFSDEMECKYVVEY